VHRSPAVPGEKNRPREWKEQVRSWKLFYLTTEAAEERKGNKQKINKETRNAGK
jgi:hypothetical protein